MTEQRKPLGYFIGHVKDHEHRYKASSGGIGTMLQKYLLSTGQYGTSITFQFNAEKCMYETKIIHSAEEVNICGSIYQDINIAYFVRDHIKEIANGIVVSCPPCQVTAIRNMLNKEGIPCFIISFCCSGQTTIEGTWKYYELVGIKKEDVVNMQYRGHGWPSGIQIWLKDGKRVYKDNWTQPWDTLYSTYFYKPKRCRHCTIDTSYTSDISLADPWLKDYLDKDDIGNTLFLINTEKGQEAISLLSQKGQILYKQTDFNCFYTAQRPNIEKRNIRLQQNTKFELLAKLAEKPHFKSFFTKDLRRMQLFIKIRQKLQQTSIINYTCNMAMEIIQKIKNKCRFLVYSHKLGGHDGNFVIHSGVIVNNSKYVFIGKDVSIGSNTFLNTVTFYKGTRYNPVIKIGEGTSIGKHCTLSSINRVEIGKHVLFAGQVHITDHSHGYEDINLPITPQQLITKGPVEIEDDCWLGYGCEILSGVHIGKHCVVAARAVVTKDVPAYSIVAGNPARIVKHYNFDTKQWEPIKRQ